MSLKKHGKIEIQKDLNNVLLKVQKELKKKMFPRKHTKLLWKDVVIELGELNDKVLGRYEIIEDKKHKHRFTHKVIVSTGVYDEFKNGLYGLGFNKRWTRKRMKDTIAHELIHAYAYEKYEWCDDGYGFHRDGSPIFLSIITFLNIPSGHPAMKSFKYTEIYNKLKEYDNFEALESYLIHLHIDYDRKFRELETIMLEKERRAYSNNFEFSYGKITGIKGESTSTAMLQGYIGKANTFTVGANADINNLKELVLSKINRNIFERRYVMLNCESIEEKKNKYKLQSMNI